MGTLRLIAALLGVCLCSACSRPAPDAVVDAMLAEIADKNYTRALRYCGERVWYAYSNSFDLTMVHRNMCDETTYTLYPGVVTGDLAYVYGEVRFDVTGDQVYMLPVRFDLEYDGRWLVEDVWRTTPEGRLTKNMLDNLRGSIR